MSEKDIESIVRDLVESLEKKDTEKALSFFADDAIWYTPQGIFKGKNEIKRYIVWMTNVLEDLKFNIDGVGILVQGNKSIHQSTYEGKFKGVKVKAANVCTYEFSGDKIKNHWTINDRLSIAKQSATGPIAKKAVNTIVARSEEGLW